MEKIKDQLKRWLSRGGKATPAAISAAKPLTSKKEASASEISDDVSWKSGVTPIAPPNIFSHEPSVANKQPETVPLKAVPSRALPSAPIAQFKPVSSQVQQPTTSPDKPLQSAARPIVAPQARSFAAPGLAAIARPDAFRLPADWVKAGIDLQSPGGGRGKALPVRIGIDFGTAYTKVSLRAADQVFFLTWGGVLGGGETLYLPGELSQLDSGAVFLGRAKQASSVMSNLKLPFLPGAKKGADGQAASVIFLAWVMRYARAWFYREQPALTKDRKLAWEVNIGCPTNAWESSKIVDLYRHIGLSAWRLSQSPAEIGVSASHKAIAQTSIGDCAEIGLDGLYPIPEFVAQIAGYARSPQRRGSLHLLVDCGAGTLDVVTFNVHRQPGEDNDRYPIFSSAVEPLGTHFLMSARLSGAQAGHSWDDVAAIPSAEELSKVSGTAQNSIELADRDFLERTKGVIAQVIRETRQRRSPLAPAWEDGLPFFLTGGGAYCEVYRRAVDRACQELRVPAQYTPFPHFDAVRGNRLGDDNLHRMSVAFGLTYDRDLIGRIVPAHEIEDLVIGPKPPRERPDRDELYAK